MLTLKIANGFPYKEYPGELSSDMSIFQSAEMEHCFFQNAYLYSIPKHMLPRTYTVLENEKPVLLFPALSNKNRIELAGHANGLCELNLVYFKDSESQVKSYLLYLLETVKISKVKIDRIRDTTLLARILGEGINGYSVTNRNVDNVEIDFSKGYAAWFDSLSKSVRQNCRTAYNRLKNDVLMTELHTKRGGGASFNLTDTTW